MTTTVKKIIELCAKEVNDTDFIDFESVNWFEYINDAQRAIALVRPDAMAAIINFILVTGTKQALPTGNRRLMSLTRNMGSDGATIGRAITGPIMRDQLDAFNPNWHQAAAHGAEVKNFMYNEANPLSFYVYPGVITGTTLYVEGEVSKDPTDVSDHNSTLDLPDIYAPAAIEWCLYRAWSGDSERSPNWAKAGRKFQNFFALLGVKVKADMAISPKVIENEKQMQVSQ